MRRTNEKIQALTRIAMFAAILAVCSQISFPLPTGVPVTLQTFAVALAGYALGAKRGAAAVLAWCCIGLLGAPVFSNFMSGPAVLFNKTGGFIFGFFPMVLLCGISTKKNPIVRILLSVLGLLLCHLCGVLQFALLANTDFIKSALLVSLPYVIKDIVSMVLADRFAAALHRILSHTNTAA